MFDGTRKGRRGTGNDKTDCLSRHQRLLLLLLAKHPSTHLQHHLKAFPTILRILSETLHTRFFHLRLDLLPPTAQCGDLRSLMEIGLVGVRGCRGSVDDGFAHVEHIRPGEVAAVHGDLLIRWVDVGNFVDVGGIAAAEEGDYPGWSVLFTGDETFGAELMGVLE